MKLSVSVPDDLWFICKEVMGSDSASEVVQIALRYYITHHHPSKRTVNSIARRIAEQIQENYLEE